MKQLIRKFKQISLLLLVISLIGCEEDEVLVPQVISGFTHTINADTGTVTFINISVNSEYYFWEFGDGTSSTLKNPVKTYTPGEYTVTLKASNVAGASDTSEDLLVISDVGAPVITVLGDTTINIMVGGDPYVDAGATAIDDVDGDITDDIVIVGVDAVDVDTEATYTITYNVSDAAGNAATERTRTVIVAADNVAPVITLIGSATINMMVGDDPYSDDGATAMDDVDGDITANIVVVGVDAVDVDTAATYTITYNVSDAAGNEATEVTRTVIVAVDGGGIEGNLANNGNFETGNTSGWTAFVDAAGASFAATNAEAACGTYSGNLVSDFNAGAGGAVDAVVKQANIGIGTITPNTEVTISFDARGSVGDGGVFFAEFFSEISGGGVSKAEILSGNPLALTDNWVHYSFTTTTGSDVSAGITLQLKTSCGPVANCVVDSYFDNVFVGIGNTGGENCSGGTGGGGTPGGGTGTGSELGVNGDFETGNTSGWTKFVDAAGASFTASSTEPKGGTYSGNLVADFSAGNGGAVDAVVKQANLGAGGTVTPNTEYVISFDLRGSASDGGVFFAEFFSELSGGGVSKAEIITGGPHPLSSNWTNYSYTVLTGPDVSGGITLQMKSSCGPVGGCLVDVSFDNVSIKQK